MQERIALNIYSLGGYACVSEVDFGLDEDHYEHSGDFLLPSTECGISLTDGCVELLHFFSKRSMRKAGTEFVLMGTYHPISPISR